MPEIIERLRNANLAWQYYKNYYESGDVNNTLENKNFTIIKRKFEDPAKYFLIDCKNNFVLRVNYPGLLTGSGYTHEYTGSDKDGAFKIGFFFDHVSGMPYITGHGIKGALRYAFPNHKNERYPDNKAEFIADLLRGKNIDPRQLFNEYLSREHIQNIPYSDLTFVRLLGELIFEGNKPVAFKNNEFIFSQLPLKDKDIFYECFISNAGDGGQFLGDDYITPHIPNPLKNPVPIKFLKILPGTRFRFQFDLKDNLISAKQKEDLFKSVLLTFGIGAKTNVGYGQFAENEQQGKSNYNSGGKRQSGGISGKVKIPVNNPPQIPENLFPGKAIPYLKKGQEFEGTVTRQIEDYFMISFEVNGMECQIRKKPNEKLTLEPNMKVRVICSNDFTPNNPNISIKNK